MLARTAGLASAPPPVAAPTPQREAQLSESTHLPSWGPLGLERGATPALSLSPPAWPSAPQAGQCQPHTLDQPEPNRQVTASPGPVPGRPGHASLREGNNNDRRGHPEKKVSEGRGMLDQPPSLANCEGAPTAPPATRTHTATWPGVLQHRMVWELGEALRTCLGPPTSKMVSWAVTHSSKPVAWVLPAQDPPHLDPHHLTPTAVLWHRHAPALTCWPLSASLSSSVSATDRWPRLRSLWQPRVYEWI